MGAIIATSFPSFGRATRCSRCPTSTAAPPTCFTMLLPRYGSRRSEVSDAEARSPETAVSNATRLVYIESPTNPLLRVHDIARWAKAANSVGRDPRGRQHLRDADQPEPARARSRPRAPQRDEVPRGPFRPARGAVVGPTRLARSDRSEAGAGLAARPVRGVPAPPKPEDPRAPDGPPQRGRPDSSPRRSQATPAVVRSTTPVGRGRRTRRSRRGRCGDAAGWSRCRPARRRGGRRPVPEASSDRAGRRQPRRRGEPGERARSRPRTHAPHRGRAGRTGDR